MPTIPLLGLATVLTLVPVTLLVPGLAELVMDAHGGSRAHAHLFMALNMMTGTLGVPVTMLAVRRRPDLRPWLAGLLLADAALFALMGEARSLGQLMAARALDGAVHLPAVTLLMVAANRVAGPRRGATLGVVAGAVMIGVAIGAPLGGVLVGLGPQAVYRTGALLLALAAAVAALGAARVPAAPPAGPPGHRYRWDHRHAHAWMPLALGWADRFCVGIFTSTFTIYLAEVLGISPAHRGLLIAAFMVPFALLCWPVGRIADRTGWLPPLVLGSVGFGLVYAGYGVTPVALLPAAMVASGVCSAMMYAPNLVLVGEMARRGAGEGLFGSFQVAGSLGFLAGPIAGGVLVEVTRRLTGEVAYAEIFAAVGAGSAALGLAALVVLRPLARAWAAAPDTVAERRALIPNP